MLFLCVDSHMCFLGMLSGMLDDVCVSHLSLSKLSQRTTYRREEAWSFQGVYSVVTWLWALGSWSWQQGCAAAELCVLDEWPAETVKSQQGAIEPNDHAHPRNWSSSIWALPPKASRTFSKSTFIWGPAVQSLNSSNVDQKSKFKFLLKIQGKPLAVRSLYIFLTFNSTV